MHKRIRLISTVLPAISIIALLLSVLPAGAATALKVKVPWDRAYIYWTSAPSKDGEPEQSAPVRFKGKTTTLEIPASMEGAITLTVYDTTTGNAAVETLKPPFKEEGLSLQSRDFDEVRRVQIKITADKGKPVESALVTLTDIAGRTQTSRVDPTTGGIAEFTDVTAGDASVSVKYGDGKKASQDVTVQEEREDPIFFYEVPVAGPVVTIDETASGQAAEESADQADQRKARRSGSEFAVALISAVFGFIVLAGIVVGAIFYIRSKGVTLESGLRKVGVELPDTAPQEAAPAQGTAAPTVDPSICEFCGQKKDPLSGQCSCSVTATPSAGAATGPRLVGVQGAHSMRVIEMSTDVTTIGREADNIIPLSEDSTVSRRHARIVRADGSFVIHDEGSSNGTFVNGDRITERTLQSGDEIQIGSSKFRFEA